MELFSAEKYRGLRVCVALSGGLDSVCLLHAFRACAEEYRVTLSACHLEHGIRGEESLRDMRFCESLCAAWSVPLYTERVPVQALAESAGKGLEEVGREVRYRFFASIVESGKADVVATAHQMNDVAETVLFRMARGTALAGMRGITEHSGVIRPLLGVTRRELERYAEHFKLPHIEDSTNFDENYSRNRIRHSVLAPLEEVNEEAVSHIARFASFAAEDDEFLQQLAAEKIVRRAGEYAVPVELPDPLFLRACVRAMKELGALEGYTYAQLGGLLRLRELQSGKRASLACGREAVREYGHVVFYNVESTFGGEIPFAANVGTMYEIGSSKFTVSGESGENALRVDLDRFPEGCVVRTRREGDFITPYHAQGKSLKKFLTDRKVSARLGRKLPLIAKGSEILVVVGVEIADSVKVTESTKRIGFVDRSN